MSVVSTVSTLVSRADSWINAMTGLGTLRDKLMHAQVVPGAKLGDGTLETLFNDDDIARRVITKLPREATRRGFEIVLEGDDDGEDADPEADADVVRLMEDSLAKLDAVPKLRDAWIWARLYGGGGVFVGADDGLEVAQPLNESAIRSIRFLNVVKRTQLTIKQRYEDLTSPLYGEPEIYTAHAARTPLGSVARTGIDIHASRMIMFRGARTAQLTNESVTGWDDSVLQTVFAALQQSATGWQSVAHLMTDASQGVLKVANLVDLIATGGQEALRTRIAMMDLARSVCRAILVDAERESFERVSTSFTGLPEVMDRLMMRVASAAEMPVTLLFGRSPAGLNATGESDIRGWYDVVADAQNDELRPRLERLLRLMFSAKDSPTRGRVPERWSVEFAPLWQPTDRELAETKKITVDSYVALVGAGIMTDAEAGIGLAPDFPCISAEHRQELMEADLEEGLRPSEVGKPEPEPDDADGGDDPDDDDEGEGGSDSTGPKGRTDANQPRVPAGSPEGGRFASMGGSTAASRALALAGARAGLATARTAHAASPTRATAAGVAHARAALREERRAVGRDQPISAEALEREKANLDRVRRENPEHAEEAEDQVIAYARLRGQVAVTEAITEMHTVNVAEPALRRVRQQLYDDDIREEWPEGPRGDKQFAKHVASKVREHVDDARDTALERLRAAEPNAERATAALIHSAARARVQATHREARARAKQLASEP